jgi:hypothetical protein
VIVGVTKPEHVAQAFGAIRKAGTCVVTGVGNSSEVGLPISITELTFFQKRLQGSAFGASNPNWDIKRQMQLYRDGTLKLDELVTTGYPLDEVAQGYQDVHDGKNVREVIIYTPQSGPGGSVNGPEGGWDVGSPGEHGGWLEPNQESVFESLCLDCQTPVVFPEQPAVFATKMRASSLRH